MSSIQPWQRLDIQLLNVLVVLLEEQHVTAAANRLHLTQSAVSKHLSKLRDIFDDQLFERSANGLKPTPKALQLGPTIRPILQQLEQLTRPSAFNPAKSQRRYHIHLLETAYSLCFPHFMPDLLQQAPNIQLNTQVWGKESLDKLLRCEIELGISCREWDPRSPMHVNSLPSELSFHELHRDESVCLLRHDHPALVHSDPQADDPEWSIDTFLRYRHIQVTFGGLERWLLDDVLLSEYRPRDIAIDIPDFYSAMSLCEQTDLLLCAPKRHAQKLAKHFALSIKPIPVSLVPGAYLLMWHKHYDQDLGHQWLRKLIATSTSTVIEK